MSLTSEFLQQQYGFSAKLLELCDNAEKKLGSKFAETERIAEHNQYKVLHAMQKNRLSEAHFAVSSGYGYNDMGRDVLEQIYADIFHTEAALVRPQMISGTHALTTAMFGNLKAGDELLYVTGAPYDTLRGVIGIRPERGSMAEHGIIYKQVDLKADGKPDFEGIRGAITAKTRMVGIQRSKGYGWRHSLTTDEIGEIIDFVKGIRRDIVCMVDNCYGEFVDYLEPTDLGADMAVGSLIKNPGGGLASVGGYIAGTEECVENAAVRLTCPGMGREVGPSLGLALPMLQGLFLAPQTVCGSIKGAIFASEIFSRLGYDVLPTSKEQRADIVQAICLNSAEALSVFCGGIQAAAPVDSYVTPVGSPLPGYDCPVIMAAGAFVQGSSIELSADAPVQPPYIVYFQGGLTWHHAKIGVMTALDRLVKAGIVSL